MTLTAFTGTITESALNDNYDDKTTRIDAAAILGRVDHPITVRRASLAVANDIAVRSVMWTAPDDAEVRVLRVLCTHSTTGLTVTATLDEANGLTDFMMGENPTVSVASINGTAQASLDLRTTTGKRIMLLRGVRYRLSVAVVGGTADVGQATVVVRTRRRTR